MNAIPEPDDEQVALIWSIAKSLGRQFHPDCDWQDIGQELFLKWYTDYKYLQRYLEDEDEKRGWALLSRSLRNEGLMYCKRERAALRGYSEIDEYYYSLASLRLLLPLLWDTDSVSSYAVRGEKTGRSMKPANEGGDFMAMKLDVELAWRRITQEQRDLLYDCWVEPVGESDALSYGLLAADEGCEPEAMRKRAERALTALQRQLGGPRPVERRKAVSNAAAQSQTRNDYGSE